MVLSYLTYRGRIGQNTYPQDIDTSVSTVSHYKETNTMLTCALLYC